MRDTELLEHGLWAFVATTGFAVLFNVPSRVLLICGFTGAMGHMWRQALLANGAHPVAATFVGAMVVGMLGYSQARFFHVPRLIFTVTGIIPMVPGVPAFETIVFFMRDDIQSGLQAAVRASLQVGAISFGLVGARLVMTLGGIVQRPVIRGSYVRLGAYQRTLPPAEHD